MPILRTFMLIVFFCLAACVQEDIKPNLAATTVEPTRMVVAKSSPQGCKAAIDLNYQVHDLYRKGASTTKQKRLLEKALQICPNHAESHNNLAEILREEEQYAQAITHYRQALDANPSLSAAWHGLGETYHKQGQFPLSLEAHLHACQTNKDSKTRIVELLKNNQYAVTEAGEIINKESLLVLYDEQRRASMKTMMAACGFKAKMQYVVTFRNLVFNSGKATLKPNSNKQLNQIAAALKVVQPTWIKIDGHSDNQRWRGKNAKQSQQLNLKLSQQRANTVKKGLIKQNVEQNRIQAKGHGSKHPLVPGNSKTARDKNRRVEIAVK